MLYSNLSSLSLLWWYKQIIAGFFIIHNILLRVIIVTFETKEERFSLFQVLGIGRSLNIANSVHLRFPLGRDQTMIQQEKVIKYLD